MRRSQLTSGGYAATGITKNSPYAIYWNRVTITLSRYCKDAFEVSDRCTHIKGNGGSKGAVKQLAAALPDYRFVFRTDVKSFYASIDHWVLYEQLILI
jgi:hypothetical protein